MSAIVITAAEDVDDAQLEAGGKQDSNNVRHESPTSNQVARGPAGYKESLHTSKSFCQIESSERHQQAAATSRHSACEVSPADRQGLDDAKEQGAEQVKLRRKPALAPKPRAKRAINILLLGETGIGKSTTINSLAAHLRYSSLEEAEQADTDELFLIPVQFNEINKNDYGDIKPIKCGPSDDNNEDHIEGESATKDPKVHVLELENIIVSLIDTPGTGDTHGEELDKENVDKILKCLTHFDHLNAICLLMNPTQSRLTDRFKYCLTEILRNLDESASSNILMCFTRGKSVNYTPGDAYGILRAFMSKDHHLRRINIANEAVIFLENEPVRYLARRRCGVNIDDDDILSAKESWNQTSIQVTKMFAYVNCLPDHSVIGTISINDARRAIANSTQILVDVVRSIELNMRSIDQRSREINDRKLAIEREPAKFERVLGAQQMYYETVNLAVRKLPSPRLVCLSAACSGYGANRRVTHKVCEEDGQWKACPSQSKVMDHKGNCKKCNCSCLQHRYVTTETGMKKEKVIRDDIVAKILNRDDELRELQNHLKLLETRKRQCEREKSEILKACAKLAMFLKQNALLKTDETNNFQFYIQERRKAMPEDRRACGELSDLESIEREYMSKLDDISKLDKEYLPADVKPIIEHLYQLPLNGPVVREAVKLIEESTASAIRSIGRKYKHK